MNSRTRQSPEGGNGSSSGPGKKCVHELFELEAGKGPGRIALEYGAAVYTYSELNERANGIAHLLLNKGISSESLVAVAMERSPDLVASILGILKAGGAYMPLDLAAPAERQRSIMTETRPSVLITSRALLNKIPKSDAEIVYVDDLEIGGADLGNPEVATCPGHLAYVMYTSGSTGRPKGVMVEHRSIVRLVKDTDYADFAPGNVFLQFAPATFDASTFEIWGALLNGARLVIMPDGTVSLADLGNAIRDHKVTTLWLTAGLFNLMVDERIGDLRQLRQLLAGGDVLSPKHVAKALENLDCDLINGYGPTENTTFTCTYKIPRDGDWQQSIPIGKPIANTQVAILDDRLEPVADGEVGELYIGGEGLARGYFNSAEMTGERFISNPFPHISSLTLYRSGDRVRMRPDGNIEFLGRADNQVKVRGFRIELDEVELALLRQGGVRQAAVVVQNSSADSKKLIAFVVPEPGQTLDETVLRNGLLALLPEYMVPFRFVTGAAMPLTTNGKVDRNELIRSIGESDVRPQPLVGGPEPDIAMILEQVLGHGPIGPNDNFFDLGADSLQLARFHARLEKAFAKKFPIVTLFQNPTINSLSRHIGRERPSQNHTPELRDRAVRQRAAFARRRPAVSRAPSAK